MTRINSQHFQGQLGRLLHLVGAAVTCVVLVAAHATALHALNGRHDDLMRQAHTATEYLACEPEIRARHERLLNELREDEQRMQEIAARIPNSPRESEFLAQIAGLARSAKVQIRQYQPHEAVAESTHTAMEVDLNASASYAGLCSFLNGLESLPRLCRVTHLDIVGQDDPGAPHEFEITLRIYFAPSANETRL